MTSIHASVARLQPFVGKWVGQGQGEYEGINNFTFRDEIEICSSGQPFLSVVQRTFKAGSDAPLHSEMGYWRCAAGGDRIEALVSHCSGFNEVAHGDVSDGGGDGGDEDGCGGVRVVLQCGSEHMDRVQHAKEPLVTGVRRVLHVSGDRRHMRYTVQMSTSRHPHLATHLVSSLTRQ